jgi:hypothetical protein
MMPGVTHLPAASITVAPAGIAVSAPPIACMTPSASTTVPSFDPAALAVEHGGAADRRERARIAPVG